MSAFPRDTAGRDPRLWRWERIGLTALAVIVATVPLSLLRSGPAAPGAIGDQEAAFVGGAACRDCHQVEWERWTGSDHDLAMDVATEETVLGDFDDAVFEYQGVTSRFYRRDGAFLVSTEGPDGAIAEFQVAYVFGHEPLQQYLVPFPGGRLQTLSVTWDTERKRWYRQYPGQEIPPEDWLHWTRGGQNWNSMCAECHSTNLRKGYDPDTDSYETTWTDIDVGCEACHGPGSRHVAWAKIQPMARPELPDAGLVVSTSRISPHGIVELCAPCHSRRAELGDYDHTGSELLDEMLPSLLEEGLYHADGQILDEVYVYGSFLQSKMYAREVGCPDCHDSHSLKLHREGNDLCLQCHQREVYDTRDHHFHKKIHEGKESDGAKCVKCHMVERPYMVIDWRADHSFRVPRPDLTASIGVPNACTQSGCHDDRPLQWSLDAYRKWYGEARKPQFGTAFAAARAGDAGADPELGRLAASDLQSPIVRATALELLARSSGPEEEAALAAAIDSDEPLLRRTAAAHLVLRTPADVERLAPLLSDPVKAVRMAAVSGLAPVPRDRLKPYQQEAFEKALAEYRESMAYELDFASSSYNLGNLEAAMGNAVAAERYYRNALRIDDGFSPAKLNLAILLSGQGRNREAETLLREIVRDYPDHAEAMYSLGLLLVEMGRPEEAVDWLSRSAARNPGNPRVRYNLGLLEQQLGRLDDAERSLRAALDLEPEGLDYLYALADHLLRRGRTEEARDLARRIIELYPEQPIGQQLLAAAGG
ncbi:MAG: tetratricopeptide repeat protein [Acidobacteriota bacterium]